MRRWFAVTGAVAILLALLPLGGAATAQPADPDVITGSYIVVLKSGDPNRVAAEHSRQHNATVSHVYRHALQGYAARMSAQAAARIARDARVASVEADRVVTTTHHQCGHAGGRGGAPDCGTVTGTVTDASDGTTIAGATVSFGSAGSTSTAAGGSYSITVPAGDYSATASKDGYETGAAAVTVGTGGAVQDFSLEPSGGGEEPEEDDPINDDPPVTYVVPTGVQRIFWQDAFVGPTYPGIAVIDTGIADHDDLNIAGGRNCTTGNPNNWRDGNGHGTHVAGTIAANGGIVGVAPGAPLYAVKVLNNGGSGTWSGVICGVDWVTANASSIKVANMSLGGSGTAGLSCSSSSLRQAICNSVNAGVTYAVSAGNSATDARNFVPAAYPEVITVAAIADFDGLPGGVAKPTCRNDTDDTHANFSNYGSASVVDITAPGVCITSTWTGGGYNTISGTSMSSPHVAGAAALWFAGNSGGPAQVRNALKNSANGGYDYTWGSANTDVPGSKPPLLDVSGF